MTGWAIWYGSTLDGVTTKQATADEARERGATVIPMRVEGDTVRWADIPQPEPPGLPLGWHESEVVSPGDDEAA